MSSAKTDNVHLAALHVKTNLIIIGKHALATSALIGPQLALGHTRDNPLRLVELLSLEFHGSRLRNHWIYHLVVPDMMIAGMHTKHTSLGTESQRHNS